MSDKLSAQQVKICTKCHQEKSVDEFYKHYDRKRGTRNLCKECCKKRFKLYRITHPERVKQTKKDWYQKNIEYIKQKHREKYDPLLQKAQNIKRYGITMDQYYELLRRQNDKCAICGRIVTKLCIDHNHTTNKIRGLLCPTCNFLLGYADDNKEILFNAIKYLEDNE